MNLKPRLKDLLWMAAGAAFLLVVVLLVARFHKEPNPSEQLAFKAQRTGLVAQMRLSLGTATEAEKSAVLAVTDLDSQTFADQAGVATAEVERARDELEQLFKIGGTQGERDLLSRFSAVFVEFQRVDRELLELAVKNTNLKAYALSFGPEADALRDLQDALSRLVAKTANGQDARAIEQFAFGAEIAALRSQTLLAPHIAEVSAAKMDELEAQMTRNDQEVHKDLDALAMIPTLAGDSDLAAAAESYARFNEIRGRILVLSRENTNVRSLAISLDQKRKVTLLCQDALNELMQAILEEPITDVDYRLQNKTR